MQILGCWGLRWLPQHNNCKAVYLWVSHLNCLPAALLQEGHLTVNDPLTVPAAEAVLMRSCSRRVSLGLSTRSSSCATSAPTGSSAALPTDVCSTIPQVGVASHLSRICQGTPTCQNSRMYYRCRLCLQLRRCLPNCCHCGGQCRCQPAAGCRGTAAPCKYRVRPACLQACCVLEGHSTACRRALRQWLSAKSCCCRCHSRGGRLRKSLEQAASPRRVPIPTSRAWKHPGLR